MSNETVLTQLAAIRAGRLRPSDLLEACLARMDALNPTLNAVVTRADERARQEAQAWDLRCASGDPLPPLAGVPVLIKDNQRTAGIRTTLGSARHLQTVPEQDAGIVARLRAAGAVVVGKTNIPEYSIGANTVNPLFGATGNPFDVSLTCGGSSGGSAVAVASDMTKLATGSDHGGSLRIPASYCGVVGYRATPGVVPNEERRTPSTHYSLQGPMAQTVTDAALMLSVIAARTAGGHRDPMAFPLDAAQFAMLAPIDLSRLRVAVSADLGGLLVSAATRAVFDQRMAALAPHFACCDWHDIDLREAPAVDWLLRQDVFVSQYFEEADDWEAGFSPNIRQTYEAARGASAEAIARARYGQLQLMRQCEAVFDEYDLLITPGVGVQPFPWRYNYPQQVDGQVIENYMAWLHLTSSLTVTGQPVVALPLGLDGAGLPFGVQLVGPRYADHRLLSMAHAVETHCAQDAALRRPVPEFEL